MIHVSALHGTPLLVRLGAVLVSALHSPSTTCSDSPLASLGVIDARQRSTLACNILSDAMSLLSDESHRRGVIGGSTLDGQTVCILARDPVETMQGIMSVWAAGGVALPLIPDNSVRSHSIDWQASAILVAPGQRDEADDMVRTWPDGSWVTSMSSPDDADAISDLDTLSRYAVWVRDLHVDDDGPALIIAGKEESRRTLSHSQVLNEVLKRRMGTDSVDSLLKAFWALLSRQ